MQTKSALISAFHFMKFSVALIIIGRNSKVYFQFDYVGMFFNMLNCKKFFFYSTKYSVNSYSTTPTRIPQSMSVSQYHVDSFTIQLLKNIVFFFFVGFVCFWAVESNMHKFCVLNDFSSSFVVLLFFFRLACYTHRNSFYNCKWRKIVSIYRFLFVNYDYHDYWNR